MAQAKKNANKLGSWAFTFGVVVAILLGVIGANLSDALNQWLTVALIVIGLIVGFLNVTAEEAMGFLTTTAILVIVMYTGTQTLAEFATNGVLNIVLEIFLKLNLLFVPATIVVAVKTVWNLARD